MSKALDTTANRSSLADFLRPLHPDFLVKLKAIRFKVQLPKGNARDYGLLHVQIALEHEQFLAGTLLRNGEGDRRWRDRASYAKPADLSQVTKGRLDAERKHNKKTPQCWKKAVNRRRPTLPRGVSP